MLLREGLRDTAACFFVACLEVNDKDQQFAQFEFPGQLLDGSTDPPCNPRHFGGIKFVSPFLFVSDRQRGGSASEALSPPPLSANMGYGG